MNLPGPLAQWRRAWFPKGVRRATENWRRRVRERTTPADLERLFTELKIPSGSVVCVHSMLSGIGYLTAGPRSVIDSLQRAVPRVTVMVPTFPFTGAAREYVAADPLYDPSATPSRSGLLTETVRTLPGTMRSLHPTHPCAALGPCAAELIDGSERSESPFGDGSTYGRYSGMENAVLLLIHTNATSIVHRFQEMVGMPNLFLPGLFGVRGLNAHGGVATYHLKIHTPKLPLYVAMPGAPGSGRPDHVWLPDYSLLFPEERMIRILARMRHPETRRLLAERQRGFLEAGVLRVARLRDAEVMAITVGPWQRKICEDLAANLAAFPHEYDAGALAEAKRRGDLY